MVKYLPWIAILVVSTGYLAQIARIHRHKEVRDLSPLSYLSWGVAYMILAYQGYLIEAPVFILKNVATFSLVVVILAQIYVHRQDEWHDDEDQICECGNEIEPHWIFCPDCGRRQVPEVESQERKDLP